MMKKYGAPSVKKAFAILSAISSSKDGMGVSDLAKKLKAKFACGGTAKDGLIELQGNHLKHIKEELVKLGFSPDTINVR